MTSPEESRIIGTLTGKLEILEKGQEKIFLKLEEISVSGCARGKMHDEKIQKLENRPKNTLSMIIALISIMAALIGFVSWMHSAEHAKNGNNKNGYNHNGITQTNPTK